MLSMMAWYRSIGFLSACFFFAVVRTVGKGDDEINQERDGRESLPLLLLLVLSVFLCFCFWLTDAVLILCTCVTRRASVHSKVYSRTSVPVECRMRTTRDDDDEVW